MPQLLECLIYGQEIKGWEGSKGVGGSMCMSLELGGEVDGKFREELKLTTLTFWKNLRLLLHHTIFIWFFIFPRLCLGMLIFIGFVIIGDHDMIALSGAWTRGTLEIALQWLFVALLVLIQMPEHGVCTYARYHWDSKVQYNYFTALLLSLSDQPLEDV
ncbi:hypothetical protein BKA82DRAFT_4012322 [Pisolithus tinctorius]|nr:hypothetical protein BKA82DRAFT_4012322 [Pisolithus tinctorius]